MPTIRPVTMMPSSLMFLTFSLPAVSLPAVVDFPSPPHHRIRKGDYMAKKNTVTSFIGGALKDGKVISRPIKVELPIIRKAKTKPKQKR